MTDAMAESAVLRIEGQLDTDMDRDEQIVMQITTGGTQVYRRAGKLRFQIDGKAAEITCTSLRTRKTWFVLFRDATAG